MKLFTSLVNGRVFNNSVSGATSQLLGDVPANPNFNGNAANIILAQVSGTEISLLLGAFEVVDSCVIPVVISKEPEDPESATLIAAVIDKIKSSNISVA